MRAQRTKEVGDSWRPWPVMGPYHAIDVSISSIPIYVDDDDGVDSPCRLRPSPLLLLHIAQILGCSLLSPTDASLELCW